MEDFVYVVVLLLISAIPAIQKGIQKKSKPKKKRMSASGNITNVITSDSAISLTFSPEQPEQTKTTTAVDGRPIYQHPRRQNESTLCQLSEISLEPEQTEQTDAVWEDFDLRKAVVYSEILRPKFCYFNLFLQYGYYFYKNH